MKVCIVVGARPNFMKMAPVMHALDRRGVRATLVHTGQHYDPNMSQVFFDELGMPRPDIHLEVGSGSHARQTAAVMTAFEDLCLERKFDIVAAGGDVNSTLAAALVAAKLNIPVAHVEAGLRSGDRTMPEEVNRVVTDHISEWLFASEPSGVENLLNEGIELVKVHHVGNCMVDTLMMHHDPRGRRGPLGPVEPGAQGLRGDDPAPPLERRRRRDALGPDGDPGRLREQAAADLPGPPADPRAACSGWGSTPSRG
jgi:UDP-N-acetylglucosamine 2-epimerase (non-hydrolysing)